MGAPRDVIELAAVHRDTLEDAPQLRVAASVVPVLMRGEDRHRLQRRAAVVLLRDRFQRGEHGGGLARVHLA
jgi:hypothetical protein